jgi:hydrogenase/urease accessory protein HupE
MGQNLPVRSGFVFVVALTLLAVMSSLVAQPAQAHQTAISTLNVEIRPEKREVDLLLVISPEDLADHLKLDPNGDGYLDQSELPMLERTLASYLEPRLQVTNNGARCEPTHQDFVNTGRRTASLMFRKTVVCDEALGELTLENRVMLEAPKGYTHYSQIQLGKDIHTTVFNPDEPTYTLELADDGESIEAQGFWEVFFQYIWQGVLHILLGIDHVLFVLCLLLAARRFRPLLAVITSFTIAHSITLALSALEVVSLSPSLVEPLIALSIAWVAVELLLESKNRDKEAGPGKHLYVLTFLFGLLHGFGFSYVLRDEVGLPTDALVPALLSFNVGVELGQIAIVAVAFPLVVWARKKDWGSIVVKVMAAGVLLVSLYWFVTRLM